MVSGNILRHAGIITDGQCRATDDVVMGHSPILSNLSVLTVVILCTDGLVIPQGFDELPAGFPVSYPSDGLVRSDAPGELPLWDRHSDIDLGRPLNHMDIVAQQFYFDVMNPPDSVDSGNEELTYAEFVEAITESTCINDVDDWGEPTIHMMVSNPGFTILRKDAKLGTALVLFPDRKFRVFFTCDIDDALNRMWKSSGCIEDIDSMDGPSDPQARSNDAESRDRLKAFNASERFNRRLYAADMKAIWDHDHHTLQTNIPGNDLMRDEMEYANYLDYMAAKLRIYMDRG